LPRKSNFEIAQAAAIPQTVLSGTEMAATIKVSRIEERASGSVTAASQISQPLRSASYSTAPSGRISISTT
jgi:hypothetical protein